MALSISSLSPRNQIFVYAGLMLGLAYAVYTYYHAPLAEEVAMLEGRVEAMRQQVLEGEALLGQIPQLEAEVERQRVRLDHLRQVLPDQKETAQIIREVHNTAVESNLAIKSFTPQATIGHPFYDDWPILMSVEGNYESLGRFFERISEFDRLVNIHNITIRTLETSTANRTVAASCTATTYVYREPGGAGEKVGSNEIAAVQQ